MILGTWRLLLALLVVNGHLNNDWWASTFAVFSFYVISGFLITMIMNENYGFSPLGIRAFVINRVLRIYPPYLAALCLSLLVLALVPGDSIQAANGALRLPADWSGWLRNLAIVGLDFHQPARLVPPAWALHIELCFYVAIGMILGRGRGAAAAWLAASLAWHLVNRQIPLQERYYMLAGCSLPFAAGACVFHATRALAHWNGKPSVRSAVVSAAVVLYMAPYAAVRLCSANALGMAFWANIAGSALLLAVLARVAMAPPLIRKVDAFLGDLSYPVYLFHWQTGILVMHAFGLAKSTPATAIAGGAAALLLAVMESHLLSRPLGRLRDRIKSRVAVES